MHVYFLGIAGAGVSALASVLVSEGHTVTGSDEAAFPPVSTYLDRLGVRYATRFDAANIAADVDLAIIGTTAKISGADNPELAELKRRGVPCHTFADFLGAHTAQRTNILVAGSFGKSTLTAMIAFLLRQAGRDPGYFIGAVPLDLPTTGHWGGDPEFVAEADEYIVSPSDRRSKFELYQPRHTLISSVVHDHLNVFPTMESYEAAFAKLIARQPRAGLLVCAAGFAPLRRLCAGRDVVWYGVDEGIFRAADVVLGEVTRFRLLGPDGLDLPVETELLGLHNVENLVGAAALTFSLDLIDAPAFQRGARAFRGVARRLDKKTHASRVPAYEGFGSSYEKARSAIEAIASHFPGRRQVVVFEPHAFSWRDPEAIAWYDAVFAGVGLVVVLPPPRHGARANQLSLEMIAARIAAAGIAVVPAPDATAAHAVLERDIRPDDVVLLLSSGALEGLADSVPAWLDQQFG